ncbi:MAG: flagella synthesis protein FlgN [Burkholderiales bacterium]
MRTAPLEDILRREFDGMQRLGDILAEEFTLLGRSDPDAVDAVLQRKSAILDELQRHANERSVALAATGVAGAAETEAWLRAHAGEPTAALWRDLLARTRNVWTQHQTNTTLLEGLMRHNRQTLDLLTRLANPDMTYQADGSTAGGFGTRSRGQA